jgi:hypothetical protein
MSDREGWRVIKSFSLSASDVDALERLQKRLLQEGKGSRLLNTSELVRVAIRGLEERNTPQIEALADALPRLVPGPQRGKKKAQKYW